MVCYLEKEQVKHSLEKGTHVNNTTNFWDQIFIPCFDYLLFLNLPHLAPTMHWRSLSGNRHLEESNCTRGWREKNIQKLVFNKKPHRQPKSKLKTFSGNLSIFVWFCLHLEELTVSYNTYRLFFSQKKCGGERWRVKQFLDYLQVFLGVINTEWTMESWDLPLSLQGKFLEEEKDVLMQQGWGPTNGGALTFSVIKLQKQSKYFRHSIQLFYLTQAENA